MATMYQQTAKKRNKERIIKLLERKPMLHGELLTLLKDMKRKFSHQTLSDHLDTLEKAGIVISQKGSDRRTTIYSLTKKGHTFAKKISGLDQTLEELDNAMATDIHVQHVRTGLLFSLRIPRALYQKSWKNKKQFQFLPKPDLQSFENVILFQMLTHLVDNNLTIEQPIDAKAVLSIQINYSVLTSFLSHVDLKVLEKFIRDIDDGIINPLYDVEIKDKLFYPLGKGYRGTINGVPQYGDAFANDLKEYYIPAARALRYNDKIFQKKLDAFEHDAETAVIDIQTKFIDRNKDDKNTQLKFKREAKLSVKKEILNYKPLKRFGPKACKKVQMVIYNRDGYTCSNCKVSFSALDAIADHLGKLPKWPSKANPNPKVKIVEESKPI